MSTSFGIHQGILRIVWAAASTAATATVLSACGQPGADGPAECDPVACFAAAYSTCDGDTLVAYAATGQCLADGTCELIASETACASGCADGACQAAPCDSVTCDTPPAPSCDGDFAVLYASVGECLSDSGECTYGSTRTDCSARDQECVNGVCVNPGPCEGVTCDTPPGPSCEGNSVVAWSDVGECVDGTCTYEATRTSCSTTGERCVDGACQPRPACDGVVCVSPPAPVCDGVVLVSSTAGSCAVETGECVYPEVRRDCAAEGLACSGGRCVVDDPCAGVTCDEPPAAACDGNTAILPSPTGTCSDGVCSYGSGRVNCAAADQICRDGGCVEGDPCAGVVCNAPPAPACDGRFAVTPNPVGACARGECAYSEASRRDCVADGLVCRAGACVDPCDGVSCDDVPAPICDGGFAVTFAPGGTCAGGSCVFDSTVVDCLSGGGRCESGRCVYPDPCVGVACESPPRGDCAGDVATFYDNPGDCVGGLCSYERRTANCAAIDSYCSAGRCVPNDACDGVTCDEPPAGICRNRVAVTFGSGSCQEGDCVWAEFAEDCERLGRFCAAGRCVDSDPCAGRVCDGGPESFCDGDLLVAYPSLGTCTGGSCEWAEEVTDCAAGGATCLGDACVGAELCAGVDCSEVPADRCEGDTLIVATSSGTCVAGSCEYPTTALDCAAAGLFCVAGSCVGDDPCAGLACDPPAARCEGDVRVTPVSAGCAGGACRFEEERDDCAATGGYCSGGACVASDPCVGVDCSVAPAPACEGSVAVVAGPAYTCEAGTCDWSTRTQDCSALPARACEGNTVVLRANRRCEDGACAADEVRVACGPGEECLDGACVVRCSGGDCDVAPPAYCDGGTAVSWVAPGTCGAGGCTFEQVRTDCRVRGYVCESGSCVLPDPCIGVSCGSPPPPDCDSGVAVQYASPGVCAGGRCTYVETRTDCVAEGGFCNAGACESFDPCLGVGCNVPPRPRCVGNERITYAAVGTCSDGLCYYDETAFDCRSVGQFCVGGACQVSDPCSGVACNTPPAPVCSGGNAVEYGAPGTCLGGTCTYPVASVTACADGGAVCFNGRCQGGELCVGVVCEDPPLPQCEGGVSVTYAEVGRCVVGVCGYAETRVNCDAIGQFCVDGLCQVDDPCDAVTCVTPPAPRCDGNRAIRYDAAGSCSLGECSYTARAEDCAATGAFCVSGACVPSDPCVGVSCESPPAWFCEANRVVRSSFPVTCEGGSCLWTEATEDCSVPRPAYCDGSVAVQPTGAGVCTGDRCSYTELRDNCSERGSLCIAGSCVEPDPCSGVVCNSPPTPVCDGNVLRESVAPGTCVAGGCTYTTRVRQDCGASGLVCRLGACVAPDPCEGVTCSATPQSRCVGSAVSRTSPSGTCRAGVCSYDESIVEDCAATGRVCVEGACVTPDPCEGVTCDAPPAPYCDGAFALVATGSALCVGGSCQYLLDSENCATVNYGECEDGACVVRDPCDGVTCDEAPANRCITSAELVVNTPFCFDGGCTFSSEVVACDADEFCYLDACLPLADCNELRCSDPAPAFCAGPLSPVVVTPLLPGRCLGRGTGCEYDEATYDCSALGQTCDDGVCAEFATPADGDLIISEIFMNPPGADGGLEWFELRNMTQRNMDLSGLVVRNSRGQTFTVPVGVLLQEDEYMVMTQGTGAVSPGLPYYAWGGTGVFSLDNTSDSIRLEYDGDVVDLVAYSSPSWPLVEGRSLSLDPAGYSADNADPALWCLSVQPSLVGIASPNVRNDECGVAGVVNPGDVVITEIFASGSDDSRDWFEVLNVTRGIVDLSGIAFTDDSGESWIAPPGTRLAPSDPVVFAASASAANGAADFVWSGLTLQAAGDTLRIGASDVGAVDVVRWSGASWPLVTGASIQLAQSALALDNAEPQRWCADFIEYASGERGSPGAYNFDCAAYYPPCTDACPPLASSCDREVVVEYTGAGSCVAGRCEYASVRVLEVCDYPEFYCAAASCQVNPRD